MKLGDDAWAVCDKQSGEIVRFKGVLLLYESEESAMQILRVMMDVDVEVRRVRLLGVRVGRIDESEIDGRSKK